MRKTARILGFAGGGLAVFAGVIGLIAGGADTVILGAWTTIAAGFAGMVGGALAGERPRLGALLMGGALLAAGLVAPGLIPGIADWAIVFLPYLASGVFLAIRAVMVFSSRNPAANPAIL
jgi:hypothetical protein